MVDCLGLCSLVCLVWRGRSAVSGPRFERKKAFDVLYKDRVFPSGLVTNNMSGDPAGRVYAVRKGC